MFNDLGKFSFDSMAVVYMFSYLLIPVMLFQGVRITKFCTDGLAKANTETLKGLAILIIVLHHLTQGLNDPAYMQPFLGLDYLGIAMFFFFSGYGLSISGMRRGSYLQGFFSRRISRVWIPYLLANILAVGIAVLGYGMPYDAGEIAVYVLGIRFIDGVAWFINAVTFFYLLFYVCFRWLSVRKAIAALFIGALLYAVILHWFHFGANWINSALAFPMGVWVAHDKERIFHWARRHFAAVLGVSFIVTLLLYVAGVYPDFAGIHRKLFIGGAQLMAMTSFTFFLTMLLCRVQFHAKYMMYIGGISYEIYLVHMKVRYVYFDTWHGNDLCVYLFLTFFATLIFKKLAARLTSFFAVCWPEKKIGGKNA